MSKSHPGPWGTGNMPPEGQTCRQRAHDAARGPMMGRLYLAKPYSAKSKSAVQESAKPYSAKPYSAKPISGIC